MSVSNPARASDLSDNMKGGFLMVTAMAAFAVNDAMVKHVTNELSPAQIMLVRGAMASVLLFLIATLRGSMRPAREAFRRPVILRTIADVFATVLYITALANLPLSNASAIFQALPLTITLGAVLFLGERPGWRRWLAIVAGFVGVLIIIRPGTDGFTIYSLAVLGTVACCTLRDLVTRAIPATTPSIFVAAITSIGVSFGGLALLPFFGGWRAMGAETMLLLLLATFAISLGYVMLTASMRVGEIGFVAPFRYTILLFSVVLGVLFFAEVPGIAEMTGAAIVVASGLYMIYRERRVGAVKLTKAQVH